MTDIPSDYHDLFEKETYAHFVTMTEDGRPHPTPVWVDYDADTGQLLVNTERGRRKERNAARNPHVALSMLDPDNAYRFLSVIGEVDEMTTVGGREHIDELTRRYLDADSYPNPIETERVIVRIRPVEVITSG